jgi:hypothetical protein
MAHGEDRYAVILRRVWDDETFREWGPPPEPNPQFLWLYLLSTPSAGSIPGVYRLSIPEVAERFGWTVEGTSACMDEIIKTGRAEFDRSARLLFLPNGLRSNTPKNGNMVKAWRRQWRELPECDLKIRAGEAFGRFLTSMGDAFATAWSVVISGTSEQRRNKVELVSQTKSKQPPNNPPNKSETKSNPDEQTSRRADDQKSRRADEHPELGPGSKPATELVAPDESDVAFIASDIAACPFMAGVDAKATAASWASMAKRKQRDVDDLTVAVGYTLDALQRASMSKKGVGEAGPYATSVLATLLDEGGLEAEQETRKARTRAPKVQAGPGTGGEDFLAHESAEMERTERETAARRGGEASNPFGSFAKGAA